MSLHVVILNYAYEERLEALLARYFLLTGWAEGLCAAGARVSVLQRYKRNLDFDRNGVAYHFVADSFGGTPSTPQFPSICTATLPWLLRMWRT
jgi:hypothetical protein